MHVKFLLTQFHQNKVPVQCLPVKKASMKNVHRYFSKINSRKKKFTSSMSMMSSSESGARLGSSSGRSCNSNSKTSAILSICVYMFTEFKTCPNAFGCHNTPLLSPQKLHIPLVIVWYSMFKISVNNINIFINLSCTFVKVSKTANN